MKGCETWAQLSIANQCPTERSEDVWLNVYSWTFRSKNIASISTKIHRHCRRRTAKTRPLLMALWHCSRKGSLLWPCILVQKRPIYSLCTQSRVPRTSSSHWELIYGPILYSILQNKNTCRYLMLSWLKLVWFHECTFSVNFKKVIFLIYYFSLPVNCSSLFVKY